MLSDTWCHLLVFRLCSNCVFRNFRKCCPLQNKSRLWAKNITPVWVLQSCAECLSYPTALPGLEPTHNSAHSRWKKLKWIYLNVVLALQKLVKPWFFTFGGIFQGHYPISIPCCFQVKIVSASHAITVPRCMLSWAWCRKSQPFLSCFSGCNFLATLLLNYNNLYTQAVELTST